MCLQESEPSSLVAHALNSSRYRDFIEGSTSSFEGMLTTDEGLTYGGGDRSLIDFTYEVTAKDVSGQAATFRCTAVHAAHFHALREKYCDGEGDSCYIASMMHCKDWSDNNGGRAGSFYKTCDDRYIVKKINKEEWEDFMIIGPRYFDHVGRALYQRVPSCLVKVLGVYKLSFQREDREPYFVVMENLFWGRDISQIFDLKGSLRNRFVDSTSDDPESMDQPATLGGAGIQVLQDQNYRV